MHCLILAVHCYGRYWCCGGWLCGGLLFNGEFRAAWKIIKSRQTEDISAGIYALTVSVFALWLAFGALGMQWPLITSNFICLILSAFIFVMKPLPRGKKDIVADTCDPGAGDNRSM
jgi:MtN3 and saliva related transmembrane protein